MRTFITGATGLLGSNLLRELIAQGHSVTALVRSRERAARIFAGLEVQLVEGDMADVPGFADALAGHDVLFHTAAFFREYFQPGDHWSQLKAINIDGTLDLLRAADRLGVRKTIYTSSSGVIGKGAAGRPADEQTAPDALVHENLYFRSKLLAEQAIAELLPALNMELTLILPGWMWGPGDSAPTSSGQIMLNFLQRKLPAIIPGGGAPVDARDVAQAMIAAVARGRHGERYIVGGDQCISFGAIFAMLEELSGVPAPRMRLPRWAVFCYAAAQEVYGRLSGRPVLITLEAVRTLNDERPTSSAKAVRELGAQLRPFRETLRDELAWFRRQHRELAPAPAIIAPHKL